jgi:hypothetical protein
MEDTFAAKTEEVEKAYRAIGLYLSDHRWVSPGQAPPEDGGDEEDLEYSRLADHPQHAVLLAHFDVGDLAFSKRVLDPEQVDFDKSFRLMEAEMKTAEFAATKKAMQERLARGEDPFVEGA